MENFSGWLALFFSSSFFTGFITQLLPKKFLKKRRAGGGVAGSMVGAVILFFLFRSDAQFHIYNMILCLFSIAALFSIQPAEKMMLAKWGPRLRHDKTTSDHDFNETNIDEIIGQLIAGIWIFTLPNEFLSGIWNLAQLVLISFIFFRICDSGKFFGIDETEKLCYRGDWTYSIILDDVLAGAYAAVFSLGFFWAIRFP